jgi:hypothetical protein
VQSRRVLVTPDLARSWLEQVPRHQRRVSWRRVDQIAKTMIRGEWRLTAEAITFDSDGGLIQGQHRLHAVVQSGVTVEFYVTEGAPPESFAVIDRPRVRSADQFMVGAYQHTVLAAARLLWSIQHGLPNSATLIEWQSWPIDKQITYSEEWSDLADEELVVLCNSVSRTRSGRVGGKYLLTVAIQARQTDHADKVEAFLQGVRTGLEIWDQGIGPDPRILLRNRFIGDQSGLNAAPRQTDRALTLVTTAWNAYVTKARILQLKATAGQRRAVVFGFDAPVQPVLTPTPQARAREWSGG